MVSKIIASLIALSSLTLFAHENINHITTNVNPFEMDSSFLKLDHLSILDLPNQDKILFNVTHTPSLKHFTNSVGVGYRKNLDTLGLGANLYYMHTNKTKALIHQISPGVEMFYNDFQFSYNLYIPTTSKRILKTGDLYHNILSEFGLRYTPRKDLGLGLLPSYDHIKKEWSVNTRFSYLLNETFEFAVCPMYNPQGFGCTLSFGVIFGMKTYKQSKPTHRSNSFAYSYLKAPKIYVEAPKFNPSTIAQPVYVNTTPQPIVDEEEKEEIKPVDKPQDKEPFNWWKYIPFSDYNGMDVVKSEEKPEKINSSPLSTRDAHLQDFFLIPSPMYFGINEQQPTTVAVNSVNAVGIIDNYIQVEKQNFILYNPAIIEDYSNVQELG